MLITLKMYDDSNEYNITNNKDCYRIKQCLYCDKLNGTAFEKSYGINYWIHPLDPSVSREDLLNKSCKYSSMYRRNIGILEWISKE